MNQQVTSQTVCINDAHLCVHCWPTNDQPVAALAIIYHGFLAHGLYPTVRYAANRLAASKFAVVSADLQGHGRSEGQAGLLPPTDVLIQDAVAIAEYAQTQYPDTDKIFLVGSSMGGTIALNVATELQSKENSNKIAGVVLLAPMLRLNVSPWSRMLLSGLASIIPTWQIIPSSSTSPEQQYRDPIKRQECENDEFAVRGKQICVGSAQTCVELASRLADENLFATISFPLLVLVADQDVVVDNQGALDLMQQATLSKDDKTIRHYPALHGLLCEPSPLVEEIEKDMVEWMKARC